MAPELETTPPHANTTGHEYKMKGIRQNTLQASLEKELDDLWVNPDHGGQRKSLQVAATAATALTLQRAQETRVFR